MAACNCIGQAQASSRLQPQAFLDVLLSMAGMLAAFGDYVADIFNFCETTPIVIISSEEEYHEFLQGTRYLATPGGCLPDGPCSRTCMAAGMSQRVCPPVGDDR